jgi:hypothetical protein
MGIGLSAACGFRVFVPPLLLSIAGMTGHIHFSAGFAWIATWPALTAFASATILEIAAYYIPWLDNLLDSIATPAAAIAGILVTSSLITGMDPYMKWILAVVAGGGAAGLVQGTTVVARALSTGTTGGAANPLVSTAEAGGSFTLSILAILVPLVALGMVLLLGILMVHLVRRKPKPA